MKSSPVVSNDGIDRDQLASMAKLARAPKTITLDGYAASHRAVREMKADGLLPADTKVRSSKYLNNLVEQDHRNIKFPHESHAWLQTFQERSDYSHRY
jgi:transposase-like protein